tara:strand:- start:569 stop:769 length:201 start_codon:yes stop_codon:yes gene_type:complete
MAELIDNLKNKTYKEQLEALQLMASNLEDEATFIEINGSAYVIPQTVIKLINSLYEENEELKRNGL